MKNHTRSLTVFLSLLPVLGACETASNTYDRVATIWTDPLIYPCPEYRILKDGAHIIEFKKGQGRDLVDINVEGAIGNAELECITRVDRETKKGHMEAKFRIVFAAKLGPANSTRISNLPYFVSVTDKKQNILYRETFDISIAFPGNKTEANFYGEDIKLELPLSAKIKSQDYIIFTGFKLTRDQLQYNRTHGR